MKLIQSLPLTIQQAAKPMEKIESIPCFKSMAYPKSFSSQVGQASSNSANAVSLPEQVMNPALQYQVVKIIVDAIMKDAGLTNPSLTGGDFIGLHIACCCGGGNSLRNFPKAGLNASQVF